MKSIVSRVLLAALFAGACSLPGVGCVSVPDQGKQPAITTHVDDWRDEVIYQVLTDRFANGDVNNDYKVRPGYLARFQGGDWQGIIDHLDYLTTYVNLFLHKLSSFLLF